MDQTFSQDAEILHPSKELYETLSRPFHLLGCGGQTYVFESEDQTIVIKLFRKMLKPHPLRNWFRDQVLKKSPRLGPSEKSEKAFESSYLAYKIAPDLTGVFFIHLSQTDNLLPTTHFIDQIGREFKVDLNRCRFVLQKKGSALSADVLSSQPALIQKIVQEVKERASRKLKNNDLKVACNFGVIDGKIVEWDVGNFEYDDALSELEAQNDEVWKFKQALKNFLTSKVPHLLPYLENV